MAGKPAWERNFKGVKITLIVLYALSLVWSFYIAVLSGVGLLTIGSTTPGGRADREDDRDRERQQEFQRIVFIGGLTVGILSVVSCIIALYGVVKENQCIMITLTVMGAIEVLAYFVVGNLSTGMLSLLVTILTGVYAYMIGKKKQASLSYPA